MKNILVVACALFFVASAAGQDFAKVAPNNVKVLLDNDRVRVLEVTVKTGDKLAMHSHPSYIVYSFISGKAKTTLPDGKTMESEFKGGEAAWANPVSHVQEALTDGHVLVIELKEPMKKEEKGMEKK